MLKRGQKTCRPSVQIGAGTPEEQATVQVRIRRFRQQPGLKDVPSCPSAPRTGADPVPLTGLVRQEPHPWDARRLRNLGGRHIKCITR